MLLIFYHAKLQTVSPQNYRLTLPRQNVNRRFFYRNRIVQFASCLFRSLPWNPNSPKLLSEFLFLTDVVIQAHVSSFLHYQKVDFLLKASIKKLTIVEDFIEKWEDLILASDFWWSENSKKSAIGFDCPWFVFLHNQRLDIIHQGVNRFDSPWFVFPYNQRLDIIHQGVNRKLVQLWRPIVPKNRLFGSLVGSSGIPKIPKYAIDIVSFQGSNCFPPKLQAYLPSASCQSNVFFTWRGVLYWEAVFISLYGNSNRLRLLAVFVFDWRPYSYSYFSISRSLIS